MLAENSEYLNLRRLRNYALYLAGIGIESAGVGVLILLGFGIAALGIWYF
jgi:hypothetical protein